MPSSFNSCFTNLCFIIKEKEKQEGKGKKKKQCSFAEALADLDDIPGIPRKKPVVKIYDQRNDCKTGLYEVKERKIYPRSRERVPKVNKSQAQPNIALACPNEDVSDLPMHFGNDDTEPEEANVNSEFWETLEEIEAQFPKKDEKTEWTRRKENLEENWVNSRNFLLNCLLLKECTPDTDIACCKCSENVAVIRCEACRELMCSDCDNQSTSIVTINSRRDTLTEHTAFWNERKIEKLAASLAKQYKKTQEKICNIGNEKTRLLDSAGVKIDDKLIEDWEVEFRTKSEASLQRQNSVAVVNQLAEYFKLHQEVFSVPMLEDYVTNTDKACSIITGQEEVYEVLNTTKEACLRKRRRMEQLEAKLVTGEYRKVDALRDGKEFLTQHTLELLRTRLLHTYLNIQQQKMEVSRLADTSKKRIKIRKTMSKNSTLLEATVEKYNKVKNLSTSDIAELDKNDVASGTFAWQADKVQYRVPVWLRKQIVDKHVILKRCKEEISLLVEEMTSYVYFYYNQLRLHEADITELRRSIGELTSGAAEVAVVNELKFKVQDNQNKEDLFHHLSEGNTAMKLQGLICLRQKGVMLFKERLGLAAYWFKKVLGPNFDVPREREDDNDDDADDSDIENHHDGSEEEDETQIESEIIVLDSVTDGICI
eukprot:Seg1652.5 transcript_id=Seg1652.5/GoldUCD/mRNA.D3Y31 product="hypothetical protein" protein_id=Seg1652.5/GoldUCD/D3Y31